jgi:hypothetical protein
MSRPLRIDLENGIYHVTSGNWERRVQVCDDRDRRKWFELLDRVVILNRLAWRPSQEEIEQTVAKEFDVEVSTLFAKRIKGNDARVTALYLIRKLASVPATELAEQYGGVSQAAISKTVQRSEVRRQEHRSWKQRRTRLEKSLRGGKERGQ